MVAVTVLVFPRLGLSVPVTKHMGCAVFTGTTVRSSEWHNRTRHECGPCGAATQTHRNLYSFPGPDTACHLRTLFKGNSVHYGTVGPPVEYSLKAFWKISDGFLRLISSGRRLAFAWTINSGFHSKIFASSGPSNARYDR
jgi:hypothetical protein